MASPVSTGVFAFKKYQISFMKYDPQSGYELKFFNRSPREAKPKVELALPFLP